MRHMLEKNIGLITVRQVAEGIFNHCLVSEYVIDNRITLSSKGIGFLFPLYLYNDLSKRDLFSNSQKDKEPNFSVNILKRIVTVFGKQITPEELFYYIYGILHCENYRTIYKDFLKVDFPRIPFTTKIDIFKLYGEFGKKLCDLHLLNSQWLDKTVIKYQGQGTDQSIKKPRYDIKEKRIYINPSYYFDGVDSKVWNYQIVGFQVLDKYLKDRKGRKMDDPRHYIHIATALAKTIEIQAEIDEIYPEVEKDVIEF